MILLQITKNSHHDLSMNFLKNSECKYTPKPGIFGVGVEGWSWSMLLHQVYCPATSLSLFPHSCQFQNREEQTEFMLPLLQDIHEVHGWGEDSCHNTSPYIIFHNVLNHSESLFQRIFEFYCIAQRICLIAYSLNPRVNLFARSAFFTREK